MTDDSAAGRSAGTPPGGTSAAGTPPADPDEAVRLARRRFFRTFAADAMRTAANVAGVAGALQRTSVEMAGMLLGAASAATSGAAGPAVAAFTIADSTAGGVDAGSGAASGRPGGLAAGFRSPFRVEPDAIIVLDQRRLPDDLVEFACRTAVDVRVAIIEGMVGGAPLLGQLAASALAVAGAQAADSRPYARRAILHGTANALRNAAGSAAPVRNALDRMSAIVDRRTDLFDDGPGLAALLRAEADAIIGEATLDHAALGGFGAALFTGAPAGADPLRVLTLGSVGALAGGHVGTVLAVVNRAVADGSAIEVTVCETRPSFSGTRLTGWELAQAGVPYGLIPDSGAGALIAGAEIDVVMVGAEAIAANGDTLAEAGTLALALLAARYEIPFVVVAPGATFDPEAPDGRRFRAEPRQANEVLSVAGRRIAPAGATARHPGLDLTPAGLVGAIVTEVGILEPPFAEGIARIAAAVRARWAAPPVANDDQPGETSGETS